MMEFKSPKLSDYSKFAPFFFDEGELSCEMNFISIYVWKRVYENKFYMDDKTLIFRSVTEDGKGFVFSLPYGDFDYGMSLIFDYCKQQGIAPNLWTSQGKRLNNFLEKYNCYEIFTERDNFDYIYNQSDLAELSGKKYHSKRNHISAFSKKYSWRYEPLSSENKSEFLAFSDKWYEDRNIQDDDGLKAEKKALREILDSDVGIEYKGAMIKVDDRVVAITLGSPINSFTFDIHYEKADADYPTAYTLINREFARRELCGYKYINREDDLGIEGLRKAKLSYKPSIILEKYSMIYKGE
ncbi:MAG: phosphatidylglycerol lysyltransferase domain-containing protein [Acutalibacteraceae bacterium]|nr:phosphatidylglycerol lysyltransferase domain-containing protein [Acutalibacteraceae bacterium]